MGFKEWFFNETSRSQTKLGLYPDLYDLVGQYPPLYGSPIAADFPFYFYNQFPNGIPGKDGIVWYKGLRSANWKMP